jgi:hypothetical protein
MKNVASCRAVCFSICYGDGRQGFNSRQRQLCNFFFATASRPAPEPIQPPIQGVLGALCLAIKRKGREADHSASHLAPKFKMHGTIPPLPYTSSWRGT